MAADKYPPPVVVVHGRYDSEAGYYTQALGDVPHYHARMYYIKSRQSGRLRIVNIISYMDGRRAIRVAGSRQAYGMRGVFCISCADDGFGNLIPARHT